MNNIAELSLAEIESVLGAGAAFDAGRAVGQALEDAAEYVADKVSAAVDWVASHF